MKKANGLMNIVGIVFFIFGALFAGIGTMVYINDAEFRKTAVETTATIIDIQSYIDSDGETDYDVYVEFRVQGILYSGKVDYYSSSMDIGETISVYYNPKNPNDFRGEGSAIITLIFIGLGAIFVILGLCFIISNIRKKVKKNKVLQYNTIIQANINGFDLNTSIAVNGRHPYILRASIISPYDGLMYTFESDSIWTDLTTVFQIYNITQVPVYVNPQNYKEYYVDIESFNRYIGN